ncbi:MAG: hypothetical protein ABI550_08365 [Ignavibacteriaceae bacterium]
MDEKMKNIIDVPEIKFTLEGDEEIENRSSNNFKVLKKEIANNSFEENEWAQEYYLIYNSYEMLYRNE